MAKRRAFVLDIEADNLYPYQTQVWVLVIKRVNHDRWLRLHPYREDTDVRQAVLDFINEDAVEGEEPPIISFHNGLGYDMWVLWKMFNLHIKVGPDKLCDIDVQFFDTLYASQYLLPDREGKHSLESWGKRLGDHKIDYRQVIIDNGLLPKDAQDGAQFGFWTEFMDEYCDKDCLITETLLNQMFLQVQQENTFEAFKLGQKTFFLMQAQSFTGFKFDKEQALKLKPQIEKSMMDLKDEIEPQLPPRKLKKTELKKDYTLPKLIYKKDGSFSANMEKFMAKHDAFAVTNVKVMFYGIEITIYPEMQLNAKVPMKLDDQMALKDWFIELGWEPTMWNVQKRNGKPVRGDDGQLIRTSPKIQESGQICPNLSEIEGVIPQKIVRFLSLKNRLGVIKGWLKHARLDWDGRLPAGSSGIASTHRQKHTVVANIPKAQDDVILGKEFRSLWTVDPGNRLVGCDQAALEARCEGHWTYKYDNGESARELIVGDVHAINAIAFYPKLSEKYNLKSPDFNKDDAGFKPYRSKAKNGKYAVTYGAGPPKLASTLGLPANRGVELFDAFWRANPALKELKDAIEKFWINETGRKWIPGIDGRRLYSRSQHSLVNLLFQSTGAIIVDYALCLFDRLMGGLTIDERGRPYYSYKKYVTETVYKEYIVKRVQYYHDEFGVECPEEIAEEMAQITEWCMMKAGEKLKIRVPLVGEAKIGNNWKETH